MYCKKTIELSLVHDTVPADALRATARASAIGVPEGDGRRSPRLSHAAAVAIALADGVGFISEFGSGGVGSGRLLRLCPCEQLELFQCSLGVVVYGVAALTRLLFWAFVFGGPVWFCSYASFVTQKKLQCKVTNTPPIQLKEKH